MDGVVAASDVGGVRTGRKVGWLGGESKWRCTLRITTDIAVKFPPLLVGAEWGRTALLLQNAVELRWFTEHEARAMSRPS